MTWLDRQSFLGTNSDEILADTTVGLVGLGGGNSHTAQQLAHAGIGGFILVDPDWMELTNLQRLVGATMEDVKKQTPKVNISERVIRGVNPGARIEKHQMEWQVVAERLKHCDVIIGGVDKVRAKDELDAFCRRHLIPYIDMGMDVHRIEAAGEHLVAGQVVLTGPGQPCLRCLGIVTEAALGAEGKRYKDAGGNPQVVWPNGLLASTAVGLFMQLVSPWHRRPVAGAFLEYDGNRHTMVEAKIWKLRRGIACPHYDQGDLGDPSFDMRRLLEAHEEAAKTKDAIATPPAAQGGWFHRLARLLWKHRN